MATRTKKSAKPNYSETEFAELFAMVDENQAQRIVYEYKRELQYARRNKKDRKESVERRKATCLMLLQYGIISQTAASTFCLNGYCYSDDLNLEASSEVLVKLRLAFGQCKINMNYKEIHDENENLVRVFLDMGEDYHGPKFYVVRKIDENSTCRIVTETASYKTLVCTRPANND